MNWTQKPIVLVALAIVAITVLGAGVWYFSKRIECEKKIEYCPTKKGVFGGDVGDYYSYHCNAMTITPKYATHSEAISACVWR